MQTSITSELARGQNGELGDTTAKHIQSFAADGAVKCGKLAKRGADYATQCRALTATHIGDPNGIKTVIGSTAGIQTFTSADFDGAVANQTYVPAVNVVLVLDSHADWDATTAVVTGTDDEGNVITENLSIPNGGNATVTGTQKFRTVTKLVIPAQAGTGGTAATFGTGTLLGRLGPLDVAGVPHLDPLRTDDDFADQESVGCLQKGRMWVLPEETVAAGDPVYVRVVTAGAEVAGSFRKSEDGTAVTAPDATRLRFARYLTDGSTTVPALLELSMP